MDKRQVIDAIVAKLDEECGRYVLAARDAQAGATDEQSRSENKYDTRGLESSYLAAGQSRQALEAAQAREQFAALDGRAWAADGEIGVGVLVELEDAGERWLYFVGPGAGGTEVVHEGREIIVITGQSPLGRQLLGKRVGEKMDGNRKVTALW